MLRRLLAIILCLLPLAAEAQPVEEPWFWFFMPGRGNIKRAYHLDRSGHGSSNLCDTTIGCPTLGIWFQQAVGATLTPDIGPAYVMTVNGNPTRVPGATWPAGFSAAPGYAWRMDGTADSLSVADAGGVFAADAFSVTMAVIPRAGFASGDVFIGKWNTTGNQRSWRLYTGGTSVVLDISADGTAGTITTLTKAACIAANRISWVTASCDGAGNCSIWVDGLAVATSAAMADAFDSDAAFTIGADAEAAGDVPADLYAAAYYPGALVAATHTRSAARFRGLYDGSLSTSVTYSAATPPALQVAAPADGVTPFLVDMPVNSGMLGKTDACQGVYGASAVTNLVQRSSFETWAAGAATGWTETPTGAGDATQSTTLFAHGSSSMQLNCPGGADAITVTGACLTVTGGAAYSFSWFDYLVSGTGALDVAIYEDDSADCGSPTGHTTIGVVPIAATWSKRTTGWTMQAGTIRAQVWLTLPAAAAQETVVDAVQLRLGGATDAYCGADTDASAVCTTSLPSHPSALSANGSQTIEATFCTPWAGTDLAANTRIWSDGAVGGANTVSYVIGAAFDEPTLSHYDATPANLACTPNTANWVANTPYTVRWYMSGLGGMGLTWPVGTWYTTTAGAGTGMRTAAQTTTYPCGSHAAGTDCWVTGEKTYKGWVQ